MFTSLIRSVTDSDSPSPSAPLDNNFLSPLIAALPPGSLLALRADGHIHIATIA